MKTVKELALQVENELVEYGFETILGMNYEYGGTFEVVSQGNFSKQIVVQVSNVFGEQSYEISYDSLDEFDSENVKATVEYLFNN